MNTHTLLVAVMLLAGCATREAAQSSGSGGSSGAGASASGDHELNHDVNAAVFRGSTQGFSPHSPPAGR